MTTVPRDAARPGGVSGEQTVGGTYANLPAVTAGTGAWTGEVQERQMTVAIRCSRLKREATDTCVTSGTDTVVTHVSWAVKDISIERALLFSYPVIVVLHTAGARRRLPAGAVLLAVAMTYAGILLVVGAPSTLRAGSATGPDR